MKFKYTALTQNSQKVDGALEALSLNDAQEELHKMQLSIIAIDEISEEEYRSKKTTEEKSKKQEGIQTFFFRASDHDKKSIEGTIDAKNDYEAYKRLKTEYQFNVFALYPEKANEAEIKGSEQKLILFEKQFKEEKTATPREKTEYMEKEESENNPALVSEIDKIIEITKKIISTHGLLFSAEQMNEMKRKIDELERIRTSNNAKHIAEVSRTLLELIQNPKNPEEYDVSKTSYANDIAPIEEMDTGNDIFQQPPANEKAGQIKGIFNRIKKQFGLLKGRQTISSLQHEGTVLAQKLSKEQAGIKAVIEELDTKNAPTSSGGSPKWIEILKKLRSYLSAGKIIKSKRKEELIQLWKQWREKKTLGINLKESDTPLREETGQKAEQETPQRPPKKRHDFTEFFVEVDSFVSWLLFFYIIYFFLVDFSIEKNIGLPGTFVLKTLESPLIINITLFLLLSHLILKIKNRSFRQNFIGSLFLFFFGYGLFVLLIFNF